jgi:hypothetical protein
MPSEDIPSPCFRFVRFPRLSLMTCAASQTAEGPVTEVVPSDTNQCTKHSSTADTEFKASCIAYRSLCVCVLVFTSYLCEIKGTLNTCLMNSLYENSEEGLFFVFTYKSAVHMFSGYLPIIEFSLLAIPPSKDNLLTKGVIFFNIVVLRLTVGRSSLP